MAHTPIRTRFDLHAPNTETVAIGEAVLAKNDHLAQHNRDWLAERDIVALNLMSSPGSGKTSLLERTIADLQRERDDLRHRGRPGDHLRRRTDHAGRRPRRSDQHRRRVATSTPRWSSRRIEALEPAPGSLLFIENVGNLVCPALFDLGEQAKVVIISVTEGEDKPLKYPHMFATADLVIVNKTDLLPYVDFDLERVRRLRAQPEPGGGHHPAVRHVRRRAIDAWYDWLKLDGLA